MKLLVINNIASGYGEGAIYDYVRSFIQDGDDITIRSSDGTTDLRTFLHDAEDFDLVVASGGDGTVSSVAYLLANTGIPVLPFPAGTANLLAMNLLSPTEPHALATMTRSDNIMDFDLGEISFSNGEKTGFTVIAGAGYDAAIMRGATTGKKILGPMAYLTSAVANATPQFAHFTLTIDGQQITSEGVGVLVVNFAKIQFDLSIVHDNRPRDGSLDIVVLNTKDAFGLIPAIRASVLDRTGNYPDRTDALEIYNGQTVTVESDPPLQVQYDGEVTELTTPFSVRLMPAAARFIVSEECRDAFEDQAAQEAVSS